MPYTSEYSLKSVQEVPSHHSGSSSGKRFINLLRSLFFLSPKQNPEISQKKYTSIPTRLTPVTLKRRKIESPIRSTSQYENLSNFRDLTASNNYSHVTHSTTYLPKPSPPVIPYRGCNQRQFYSPQIRHANDSNFYAQSSGIQDIKIVNLDPRPTQLVRTFSYRIPGDRYVLQSYRRPIYSESVEVNVSDPVTYRVTQQPSAVINPKYLLPSAVSGTSEKKVVSVANIPMEAQYIRPQMCIPNASGKEIVLKREYSDTFNPLRECSSKDESRRKMEIKERILAEWEHSWRPEDRKLDGSFSSIGTNREEPSMVGPHANLYSIANCIKIRLYFTGYTDRSVNKLSCPISMSVPI
ncbi:unnamed protein product [Rodentolepis nana]|uniref:Uncharacterized protein n=1 Tax=Rodentolepis nana TaxID=102285 RepID=A0A0R3TJD9_RODNA|nr:unnamed protein product [Rodentolepis nana]